MRPIALKIGQNMKYDAKILRVRRFDVHPIDDTMLMSYAMHGGLHNHGMDLLSNGIWATRRSRLSRFWVRANLQITFDRVPIDDAVRYAAEDADITLRLWQMFKPMLAPQPR